MSRLPGSGVEVGRVTALWRYPVKSMGAESLSSVPVSWHGLAGDRRWAFVREGAQGACPWLTLSKRPAMSHYLPSFVDPERPDTSSTHVRTPSGHLLDVVDPALAAELGGGVRAIRSNRGVFDEMPLALLTTQTIATLSARVGKTLEPLRFRPNILIEATSDAAYPEDTWVGSVLMIGAARIRADRRDERCVVVNFDPTTTERDDTVFRAIAQERQACLGIYGSTVEPGAVAVGDPVIRLP